MAYVCRAYRFMFLAAPATGSSAVIRAFQRAGVGSYHPHTDIVAGGRRIAPRKHTTIAELKNAGLYEEVADYFKFVGIRNPFSWHVAKYLRNKTERLAQIENKRSWINALPNADRSRYVANLRRQAKMTFDQFLRSILGGKEPFEIQAPFHVEIDFYIHQENMEADFDVLRAKLDLPEGIKVTPYNVTGAFKDGETYKDFYNKELIGLVYEKQAPFFRRFPEYSFDGLIS